MASDERSAVQAYHEEMGLIFSVLKEARRLVDLRGDPGRLEMALQDLDNHRALLRQGAERSTK